MRTCACMHAHAGERLKSALFAREGGEGGGEGQEEGAAGGTPAAATSDTLERAEQAEAALARLRPLLAQAQKDILALITEKEALAAELDDVKRAREREAEAAAQALDELSRSRPQSRPCAVCSAVEEGGAGLSGGGLSKEVDRGGLSEIAQHLGRISELEGAQRGLLEQVLCACAVCICELEGTQRGLLEQVLCACAVCICELEGTQRGLLEQVETRYVLCAYVLCACVLCACVLCAYVHMCCVHATLRRWRPPKQMRASRVSRSPRCRRRWRR